MNEVITPEELPRWMAGDLVLDSTPLGWNGLKLKRYHTPPQEVILPMVCDFAVVAYVNRDAIKWRRYDGPWETERVGPGTVSVMTRAEVSHWRWDNPVEALHVYLPYEALAGTATEVFERDLENIELENILSAEDAVLTEAASRLAREARVGGLGGQLYVEALRCQMSVQILRNYATVSFKKHLSDGGLSLPQRRLIVEFIEENIARTITLAELAGVLQLSVFHFSRKFRREFGCPPYAYVMRKRMEHAKRHLRYGNAPLKVVAADCGFADQSHMTRLFRRFLNVTPAEYRSDTSLS